MMQLGSCNITVGTFHAAPRWARKPAAAPTRAELPESAAAATILSAARRDRLRALVQGRLRSSMLVPPERLTSEALVVVKDTC